jgi:hypothetical protein
LIQTQKKQELIQTPGKGFGWPLVKKAGLKSYKAEKAGVDPNG